MSENSPPKWKHDGVRIVPGTSLDPNTAQTAGMERKAAIDHARVGAQKIWAGTVNIHPDARTGAHHHGTLESVIYVVRGRARMRWGENWNLRPKPARVISFLSHPSYRTKKSMRARPSCSNVSSSAVTMRRWL